MADPRDKYREREGREKMSIINRATYLVPKEKGTFPSSSSTTEGTANPNANHKANIQNVKYVKPMPAIDSSFMPKDHRSFALPLVKDDIVITDEDRRENQVMMEKLLSNRYQRELLSDL